MLSSCLVVRDNEVLSAFLVLLNKLLTVLSCLLKLIFNPIFLMSFRLHKEASLVLRTCGWSEEVYAFMHSKKSGAQADNEASDFNVKKYVSLNLQFELVHLRN